MKNYIKPPYRKLKPLKSGFIENSIFENNRDPWASRRFEWPEFSPGMRQEMLSSWPLWSTSLDTCYRANVKKNFVSISTFYNLMLFFDRGLCKDDGSGDSILHHLGHHLLHYGGQGLGDRHIWNHHVMVHPSQNQYSGNSSATPEISLSNRVTR